MIEEIKKIKIVVRCDFCGRKIKRIKEYCPECGDMFLLLPLAKTKVWDTRSLFPHLCENCAGKLDQCMELMQNGMQKRGEIMMRNAEINKKRREILDTNG